MAEKISDEFGGTIDEEFSVEFAGFLKSMYRVRQKDQRNHCKELKEKQKDEQQELNAKSVKIFCKYVYLI